MTNMLVALVCVVGLVPGPQTPRPAAADAAGRWDATFYSNDGPRHATMVLRKDGEKLAGTIVSDLGEAPIAGSHKGGDVSLSIEADFGSGPITITMTGKLDGDIMTGVADVGGQMQMDWGAKRSRDAAPAPAAKPAAEARPAAAALDLTGAWVLDVTTAAGSGTPTVTLEQKGETLTGRYSGQLGEAPLTGTVKGTSVTFQFPVDVQGTSLIVVYTGTVERDAMKGTVRLGDAGEGTFTGTRKK